MYIHVVHLYACCTVSLCMLVVHTCRCHELRECDVSQSIARGPALFYYAKNLRVSAAILKNVKG